jgi:hypothetical protein
MGVKFSLLLQEKNRLQADSLLKQNAEENILTYERENNRRLEGVV